MYRAPVKDLRFVLDELIGTEHAARLPGIRRILERNRRRRARRGGAVRRRWCSSRSARAAIAKARTGRPNGVTMPEGFKDAYQQFCDNGWPALRSKAEFGGQNVPAVLGTAVEELWAASNLAFKLCPMLTQGAIEAIQHFGSPQQKQLYLPKMVSGEWTGTMNLTEPQAGSDLAQVRTRATPTGPNYRHLRPEDLHHLRRARPHREHRAHGAGAHRRRAARRARHLAVHRAQVLGERRRHARRAQRRQLRLHRTQARHPRQPHLRDDVRRERRRARPAGRRAQSRPRIHVRDDERRAAVGRPRGLRAGRTRVPAGGGVGAHARAGQAAGAARADLGLGVDGHQLIAGADHRPPRRQAHVVRHEVHGRSLPRAGAVRRAPAGSRRRASGRSGARRARRRAATC